MTKSGFNCFEKVRNWTLQNQTMTYKAMSMYGRGKIICNMARPKCAF